jgi:hypothetical protein
MRAEAATGGGGRLDEITPSKVKFKYKMSVFNGALPTTKTNKQNTVAWVREWTITTERPPLVGEVSANFCG